MSENYVESCPLCGNNVTDVTENRLICTFCSYEMSWSDKADKSSVMNLRNILSHTMSTQRELTKFKQREFS